MKPKVTTQTNSTSHISGSLARRGIAIRIGPEPNEREARENGDSQSDAGQDWLGRRGESVGEGADRTHDDNDRQRCDSAWNARVRRRAITKNSLAQRATS